MVGLLQLTVFVCGAVFLGLEIVGSRVLAPYFGSSIFVWGSLISIFLAGLTIGYYTGGFLADRRPRLSSMAVLILISGLLVVLLPVMAPPVNRAIAGVDFGPRLNPLLATLCLFFLPSVFMGTVSPYAIKLAASSLATIGNTAGLIYAISTAGSIVGALLTAFYLIQLIGVRSILYSLGITLMALAMLLIIIDRASKGRPGKRAMAWGIIGMVCSGLPAVAAVKILYEKDSLYHHIIVTEDGGMRTLRFDRLRQSALDLNDPDRMVFHYTQYLHLAMAFHDHPQRALFIGLGGGSAPRRFQRDYPALQIDVAELDPEVVNVAKRYFLFQESDRMKVQAVDGRIFVQKTPHRYDMIFLDAYYADAIPFHLTTREFLQEVKAKLPPTGIVVSNIIGSVRGPESKLFRAILKTLETEFAQTYVFPVEEVSNIIVIATQGNERVGKQELIRRSRRLEDERQVQFPIEQFAHTYVLERIPLEDVPVLTDDYAPVDGLLHFSAW
ncbi:MAG TPA: fused MFS/spermidine synthase [Candidatus Tectomicrobia bacterium]|nr:fused MFS/spermidine synthase [Candidatus Tectomicrobia bacterium]